MADTPTSRTLAECRKRGWLAHVVEKWIPQRKIRVDCLGPGDDQVLDGEPGCLMIQATSTSNMSSRVTKMCGERKGEVTRWLEANNRAEVWGWAKRGKAGKRKLWTLRRVRVYLRDGELAHETMDEGEDA